MSFTDRMRSIFPKTVRTKVPTVLQMEATECGAASLAMVLAHYGLWLPLEKLREECGVSRDGSKASNLVKAARRLGCEAKGYRWTAEKLRQKSFPLILHWEFNHFVVLEGFKQDTACLNDPASGRREVPWESFRTSYTGIALEVKPGSGFRRAGKPYSIVRAVAKKLMADRSAMFFLILINLGLIFPGLATPVFHRLFIDDILSMKHGEEWMFNLVVAMVVAIGLLMAMTALRLLVLTRWQNKLTVADSSDFFWHVLRLPMQFFQQRFSAEVASRIAFNESIASVLSGSAATAVLDFFVGLFFLMLLLQYSVPLTVIGVTFSLINLAVFFFLRKKITDKNQAIQQDQGKEYGTAMNGLMMIETIKANGGEADFFAKWAGYRAKVLAATQTRDLWSLANTVLPVLFTGINTALIMTVGGFSIMEGLMTAGIFLAFQNLMGKFQEPVNNLVGLGNTLQTTEMHMKRLDDVRRYAIDSLNYPEDRPPEKDGGKAAKLRLTGELDLVNISFGYSPLEPPLLENFSLHLKPGYWVAIVGGSGSGKSTLAKLVTGLYEEWSGEVRFDGIKRRDLPRRAIVSSLASVDQDIFQITGTVRENISLFDSSLGHTDIMQAAKDACIHEDILKLDGGYEAQVSEGGTNFSGGQRQRLEIARALAVNPSLLVLDEATSALDPVTEQTVLQNIRRRGCSCFIIAHRLSTIRDADEIIVLERGKVVERGTHVEMMAHDGPYRRLIEEQDKEA